MYFVYTSYDTVALQKCGESRALPTHPIIDRKVGLSNAVRHYVLHWGGVTWLRAFRGSKASDISDGQSFWADSSIFPSISNQLHSISMGRFWIFQAGTTGHFEDSSQRGLRYRGTAWARPVPFSKVGRAARRETSKGIRCPPRPVPQRYSHSQRHKQLFPEV